MLQIMTRMKILVAVEPADFRRGIDGLARLLLQGAQARVGAARVAGGGALHEHRVPLPVRPMPGEPAAEVGQVEGAHVAGLLAQQAAQLAGAARYRGGHDGTVPPGGTRNWCCRAINLFSEDRHGDACNSRGALVRNESGLAESPDLG
jgi:hypothetical protein